MLRREIEMRNFQTVFIVLLAFSIGVSSANLENSSESKNEAKSTTGDKCIKKCGKDPNIKCEGDLTSEENITCGCRDETETYDEKSHQCIERCVQKCGDDPSIDCKGDLTTDETTLCGCANETQVYDTKYRKCEGRCAVKCGRYFGITCEGDQNSDETTICRCTDEKFVYKDGKCISRCYHKCGFARCTGNSMSDETIVCICGNEYRVFDEKSKTCKDRCTVKCGEGPYVTCEGDRKTDETIICGCNRETRIFDAESLTCIKWCTKKCGWDSNIECGGNQTNNETTICGCRDPNRMYDEESKTCKRDCSNSPCKNGGTCRIVAEDIKCDCIQPFFGEYCTEKVQCASEPCRNGGTCTDEGNTYKCICPEEYGGKDCSENRLCEIYGEEVCGKEKCYFNETLDDLDCICEDGKVFDILSQKCRVDPCASNPCRNGGYCRNKEDTYSCVCWGIYTGKDCSENVWCLLHGTSVCGDATCLYNDVSKTVSCTCAADEEFDKKLKTCKGKSSCKPDPCVFGTCIDYRSHGFYCKCFDSFMGVLCNETRIDPCNPNPCQRGGSCMSYGSNFVCFCLSIYTGDTCEQDDKIVITLIIVLPAVGGFALVAGGVFRWKRNQRLRKMSNHQVPPAVMLSQSHQTNVYSSAPRN